VVRASRDGEKVLFVIPSEARDLLFCSAPKKQQIPRANPALRNDKMFLDFFRSLFGLRGFVLARPKTAQAEACATSNFLGTAGMASIKDF